MTSLTPKQVASKRAEAQRLDVTVHVGKNGVHEATLAELDRQLKAHKLVKVRLLPAATEGGVGERQQADALAAGTGAEVIDVRGRTAVLWRA